LSAFTLISRPEIFIRSVFEKPLSLCLTDKVTAKVGDFIQIENVPVALFSAVNQVSQRS